MDVSLRHLVGEREVKTGELRGPLVERGVARGASSRALQLQDRVHLVYAAADRAVGPQLYVTLHIIPILLLAVVVLSGNNLLPKRKDASSFPG